MDSEELESRVRRITASLEDSKENPIVGGYVPPYIGKGEIKFVIIGQDPTVRNPKSRGGEDCLHAESGQERFAAGVRGEDMQGSERLDG